VAKRDSKNALELFEIFVIIVHPRQHICFVVEETTAATNTRSIVPSSQSITKTFLNPIP
jgi:hypothetical protein